MSFVNPNDMVEEDAADLQFPKECDIIKVKPCKFTQHAIKYYTPKELQSHLNTNATTEKCFICRDPIQEPYISCAECPSQLCLQCFSCGAEKQHHRSTHSYIIRHDNVQVFPSTNWRASEEKLLLDLILSCGYGNWEDIAKGMKTRTKTECQEHYHNYYFDGLFKEILGLSNNEYFPERIPYLYKLRNVDPPRHDIDSIHFKNMAGYRCARGDFDTPYDNSAESILNNIDLNDWHEENEKVANELHCAVFRAYNHRIMERKRRYQIMRNHGLLVASKTLGWVSKYSEALGGNQNYGKFGTGRFIAFMQIMNGESFDSLVESLHYYTELKKYVFKLYDLRSNGIRTFFGGRVYQKLKNRRISKLRTKKTEQYENLLDWQSGNNSLLLNVQPRRKAAPIEILGLPGYDKLSEDERNLCSTSRIVPVAYLEYKNILSAENANIGYLRLSDARRLIKIDVNKTRQIYDFLLKQGFINKPH